MPHPSEPSPPVQPCPRHRGPLPSCRSGVRSRCYRVPATSRPCSVRASVASSRCCQRLPPVALLGFPLLEHRDLVPVPAPTEAGGFARCRPLGGGSVLMIRAAPSTCGSLPKEPTARGRGQPAHQGAGLPATRHHRKPVAPVRPRSAGAGPQPWTSVPTAPVARTRPGCPGPAAGAASPRHAACVTAGRGGSFMLDIASIPARATKTTARQPRRTASTVRVKSKDRGKRLRGLPHGSAVASDPLLLQACARQRGACHP